MSTSSFSTPDSKTVDSLHGENVRLLDDDDAISSELEACLKHIFAKYCTPRPIPTLDDAKTDLMVPLEDAYLSVDGIDLWAKDTNGAPFDQETKDELLEFMDVTDEGNLTFKGFMQVYQLQTENDEEETWKDLAKHGFDRSLKLSAKA